MRIRALKLEILSEVPEIAAVKLGECSAVFTTV
jgi:hypothetical protein